MTDTTELIETVSRQSTKAVLKEFWFYFSDNRGAVLGLFVFLTLVLLALFAPYITPHDATMQYRDALLVPPAWLEGGNSSYLLGTDAVGRDILSRLIIGSRFSLFVGIVVVVIALVGGHHSRPFGWLLWRHHRYDRDAHHGHYPRLSQLAAGSGHGGVAWSGIAQRNDRDRNRLSTPLCAL